MAAKRYLAWIGVCLMVLGLAGCGDPYESFTFEEIYLEVEQNEIQISFHAVETGQVAVDDGVKTIYGPDQQLYITLIAAARTERGDPWLWGARQAWIEQLSLVGVAGDWRAEKARIDFDWHLEDLGDIVDDELGAMSEVAFSAHVDAMAMTWTRARLDMTLVVLDEAGSERRFELSAPVTPDRLGRDDKTEPPSELANFLSIFGIVL